MPEDIAPLVSEKHPLTLDINAMQERFPGMSPTRVILKYSIDLRLTPDQAVRVQEIEQHDSTRTSVIAEDRYADLDQEHNP